MKIVDQVELKKLFYRVENFFCSQSVHFLKDFVTSRLSAIKKKKRVLQMIRSLSLFNKFHFQKQFKKARPRIDVVVEINFFFYFQIVESYNSFVSFVNTALLQFLKVF